MTKDESVVEFCIIVRDAGDHLLVWWGADPRGDAPPSFGPAGQLGQSSWFDHIGEVGGRGMKLERFLQELGIEGKRKEAGNERARK